MKTAVSNQPDVLALFQAFSDGDRVQAIELLRDQEL
jgi:hypothetical protein